MKQWYLQQTPRDQRIVLVLAALVGVVMFYVWLIHPLKNGLESRSVSVAAKRETLQWMQQSAMKIRRLRGGTTTRSNKSAYVLLDAAIRNAGLGDQAERVEPAGKDRKGARVQFSQVGFDQLLPVLADLQAQYGLSVVSVNIGARSGDSVGSNANGLVSARITLEYGQ